MNILWRINIEERKLREHLRDIEQHLQDIEHEHKYVTAQSLGYAKELEDEVWRLA